MSTMNGLNEKKRKNIEPTTVLKGGLKGTNVLFIANAINSKRLAVLRKCALNHGLVVSDTISNEVDYVISDMKFVEHVNEIIGDNLSDLSCAVVNSKWFTDSIDAKKLLPANDYRLNFKKPKKYDESKKIEDIANYICQRKTPFKHHNQIFTDALDIMSLDAEFRNTPLDEVRYLAFRKASAALKCLSFAVKDVDNVSFLKDVGKHSVKIIREILDERKCSEVSEIAESSLFRTMQLFTAVYGIGPKTAKQWYDSGLRSITDVIESSNASRLYDKRVMYGLAFYGDLAAKVTKSEAERILDIVKSVVQSLNDSAKIELYLTGGFRRGKDSGHDVDILITHRDVGKEKGLLSEIYTALKRRNLILLGNFSNSDNNNNNNKEESEYSMGTRSRTIDMFDKVFTIFKLAVDGSDYHSLSATPEFETKNLLSVCQYANSSARKSEWSARRVDLIVCSYSELAFALIGWTGNDMFNRSLREYAKKEKNMKLSSHGLYDMTRKCNISAETEIQIFETLNLSFIEPQFRNA